MHGKHFESKYGFNANDQQLINLADPTNPKDGVNLQFFDRYKSVVTYDPKIGYEKHFIVLFEDKLFYALDNIPKPAGNFNPTKWKLVLSPPSWTSLNPTIPSYQVKSSEYILFDTSKQDTQILLPITPAEGETIYLIDIGGNVGYNKLNVKSNRRNIKSYVDSSNENVDNFDITVPYSFNILIFINGFWLHQSFIDEKQTTINLHSTTTEFRSQSGEVIKNYNDNITQPFKLTLPNHARHGDSIYYQSITKNNTFLEVNFDPSNLTGKINNNTTQLFTTKDDLTFTYNGVNRGWVSTTSSKIEDIVYVNNAEYTMSFNESIVLSGAGKQTIKLPTFPVKNSRVKLYTQYIRKSSEVIIDGNGKNITWDKGRLGLVSADVYNGNPVLTKNTPTVTINNASDMRIGSIEFIYDGTNWLVLETTIRNVATNPKNPEIKGNIALVNDTEILANVMTNDNVAITPSQLQKRQSTELRMGIASIATQDEVNKGTGDTKIVTPQKLQATKASETQNGLALIASQNEVNTGTNHTKIVTPKTLDNKLPNESGKKGVVSLVNTTNVTGGSGRNVAGTGIYNFNDGTLVTTPKSLHQLVSDHNNIGLVFKATTNEVLTGVADNPKEPLFVSPFTLSQRVATESRTGILALATLDEVKKGLDDTKAVTPKKLQDTKATTSQSGVISLATQSEVDTGTNNTKAVTPLTLNKKLPNENGKLGVVSLVNTTDVKGGVDRDTPGTGIFNSIDDKLVVTPKSLHQLVSDENNIGLVYKATLNEVLTSPKDDIKKPLFITPELLSKRTATSSRTGIAKLTTNSTILTKTNSTDIVVPSTLHSILDADRDIEGSKTFKNAIKFHENSLNTDGYSYHSFDLSNTSLLTRIETWLKPVPINAKKYTINDGGTIIWESDGTPSYKGVYFYERMKHGNTLFEKLHIDGRQFQRTSTILNDNLINKGWDMLYSIHNKPTPKEINAIDVNDIIVGEVQVKDYLDFIVNDGERLRIYPDKEEKKVGFAWLTVKE